MCVSVLLQVFEELGWKKGGPVAVYQDNKAAITLSTNEPVNFKGRSKYMNRKLFSVFEQVQDGVIELVYVGTDDQVADFLTKAVFGKRFHKFKVEVMGG